MTKVDGQLVHDMNSGFPGAQSPARLVAVLRLIACHHVQGLAINELAQLSGLNRTTARRLLMVLTESGFAARDEHSGRYRLGVEAMFTGMAAMTKPPIFEACRPAMKRIASRTGDSVFLIVRIGDFAHCLHVEVGDHPLHAHSLMTGQIRLLGQGTASLALAATLRDKELEQIYQRRSLDYEAAGISEERLRQMVVHTRRLRRSETVNLLTTGAIGVGVAICVQANHVAAISVASHASKMTAQHKAAVLKLLEEELVSPQVVLFKY
ncbi:IclR family transcriptional regulator [Diaphorobacter limosus]|jgi:DNA-binding IclR family transcriptional regulator|uniref:IclR family transcriptional regulator n=1 Tax=Diaphorobacter limosus TaxID=3036128 RepID=A0ABZ0J7J6_9BURK|nr:IclR family transcriptional regulator [Diaphorobacter sp. Y-1]WOO34240.1 IclR family transcriptional regulator [Diaphorobacter sp. Y-1]HRL98944.1 IclR family transcriptional regulator [Acidovorax sp.]